MSAIRWCGWCLSLACLAGCMKHAGPIPPREQTTSPEGRDTPGAREVFTSYQREGHRGDAAGGEDGQFVNTREGTTTGESEDVYAERSRGGGGGSKKPTSATTVVRVFYATDRAWTGSTSSPKFYGNTRNPEDRLDLGFCYVSIPEGHQAGELERPHIWKLEFSEDPRRHVIVQDAVQKDPKHFFSELKRDVSASPQKQMLLFVHGYNCSFEDAAQRAAQLAFDLEFDGAPMLYSWPSAASVSGYAADESSAEWTRSHLVNLLLELRERSGANVIHVIAHSMGARVFSTAVAELAKMQPAGTPPLLNQTVLAAPDIDRDVFRRDIAPRFASVAERLTIYSSADDRALQTSQLFHNYPRLGDGGAVSFPAGSKIDLIDVSGIDTSMLGLRHSLYAEIQPFLNDIRQVLHGARVTDVIRRLYRHDPFYRIRTGHE